MCVKLNSLFDSEINISEALRCSEQKSFEVGGHWPLWQGWKKTNDHAEPTKVER